MLYGRSQFPVEDLCIGWWTCFPSSVVAPGGFACISETCLYLESLQFWCSMDSWVPCATSWHQQEREGHHGLFRTHSLLDRVDENRKLSSECSVTFAVFDGCTLPPQSVLDSFERTLIAGWVYVLLMPSWAKGGHSSFCSSKSGNSRFPALATALKFSITGFF